MGRTAGDAGRTGGLTLSVRLALVFVAFLALLVGSAGMGIWQLGQLDRTTSQMAGVSLRMERLTGDWLSLTRANAVRATVLTRSEDEALRQLLTPDVEATSKRITEIQKSVEQLLDSATAKHLFQAVSDRRKEYLGLRQQVLDKRKAGQATEAMALMDSAMLPALRAYVDSIKAMADHYGQVVEADAAAAHQTMLSGRNVLVAFCLAGVAFSLLFWWALVRSVTGPVREAVDAARRIAAGDLTFELRARSRDEMGQLMAALAEMTRGLRTLVSEVAGGARTVAETSAQIAQGNAELSQRTEEQASTLQETASSMEELTSTVAQNASTAREASELANTASENARKGGAVVQDVVSTMRGISESSRQITEIIGVIDGIAFQTNILALNAAVEAARAGEQGRGFAVVAAEVRTLAQRSAQAAKEIKALIGNSVAQVDAGSALVNTAGTRMQEIVQSVGKVSSLIAEIASAGQEQSEGIEQVNTAVTQMDQVVQQNASLVEEASAATHAMKLQADALRDLVGRFRLDDEAAAPGEPRAQLDAQPDPQRERAAAPHWLADASPAPIAFIPRARTGRAPAGAEPVAARVAGAGWREF